MKRILIVSNPQSPGTDFYRTVGVFSRLSKEYPGRVSIDIQSPERLTWFHIYNTDVLLISRPNGNEILGYIQEAKAMGVKILIDMDDLLHGIPDYSPAYKHFNQAGIQQSIVKSLELADFIIYSTERLKEAYKDIQRPGTVVRNAWDEQVQPFAPIAKDHYPVRMMWRGSTTHLADLHTIKYELQQMMRSTNFQTVFVGLPKFVMIDYPPATYVEWQTLFTYFKLIRESQPDYGFFPLENVEFNHCKSNIFAIEMLAAGALPIVPDGFAEFDIPGVLKYRHQTQFKEILNRIANQKIDRVAGIELGRAYLREELSLKKMNEKRLQIVESI